MRDEHGSIPLIRYRQRHPGGGDVALRLAIDQDVSDVAAMAATPDAHLSQRYAGRAQRKASELAKRPVPAHVGLRGPSAEIRQTAVQFVAAARSAEHLAHDQQRPAITRISLWSSGYSMNVA